MSMKAHEDAGSADEPFFITKANESRMKGKGRKFTPPGHARTKSIRDLFDMQPNESFGEALARHKASSGE